MKVKEVLLRAYNEPLRLVGVLLFLLTIHTWHDPDIWYHLNLGRAVWEQKTASPATTFLFQQSGFINIYWLFQLIVFGLFSLGQIIATHLLFVLTWMLIGILWAKRVDPKRNDAGAFLLALLSVLALQTRISARPDIILFLLLFGQVLIYDSAFRRKKITLTDTLGIWGLQILAVNMQTYFIMGYLTGFCFLVAESLRARKLSRPALLCLSGLIVSSFVSPLGWNGWVLIYHYFSVMGEMKSVLMELQAPQFRHALDGAYWLLLGLTSLATTYALFKKRTELLLQILFAGLGCALSILAQRNIPFVVLFAAPLWGDLLISSKTKLVKPIAVALASLTIAVLSYWVVTNQLYSYIRVSKRFGFGYILDQQPTAAVDWLQKQGISPLRIFNEPNYGGYLAWRMPQQNWFGDSRYTEPQKVLLYFKALNDRATFDLLNKEYAFDAVLLNKTYSSALAPSLWDDPNWRPAYQDSTNAIIVRKVANPSP